MKLLLNHNAQIDLPTNVSYHCDMYMYYQCSLAMHMTVSLMYVCISLIFMVCNSCRMTLATQRWVLPVLEAMWTLLDC